jgi:hypothetical protein
MPRIARSCGVILGVTLLAVWGPAAAVERDRLPSAPIAVLRTQAQSPETAGLPNISWGFFTENFHVSQVQVGRKVGRTTLGEIHAFNMLTFIVAAKASGMLAIHMAKFHDADNIEVAPFSVVEFTPNYMLQWQPGQRSRAVVLLPDDLSRVKTIRIVQLSDG